MARGCGAMGALAAAVALLAGCTASDVSVTVDRADAAEPPALATTSTSTSATSTTATTTTTTTSSTTAPPAAAATHAPTTTGAPATTRPPIPREVFDTGFSPFATIGDLTLLHPAAQVERIGFHESGHDGARQQDPAPSAVRPVTMETRDRGTGDRTAADIVVVPDIEIRSPVTGTVIRAGRYTLYCDHSDEYVVIEPDARPGWEVKVFHIVDLRVGTGQRVEAGVTQIARHARVLPFESQVDELTAEPSWPHAHVEVVDPSIPDRPNPGGGCS